MWVCVRSCHTASAPPGLFSLDRMYTSQDKSQSHPRPDVPGLGPFWELPLGLPLSQSQIIKSVDPLALICHMRREDLRGFPGRQLTDVLTWVGCVRPFDSGKCIKLTGASEWSVPNQKSALPCRSLSSGGSSGPVTVTCDQEGVSEGQRQEAATVNCHCWGGETWAGQEQLSRGWGVLPNISPHSSPKQGAGGSGGDLVESGKCCSTPTATQRLQR